MFGDIKTKPMEILLVEDGLVDARVTILALRRSHIHHRLTLVRTVSEAIQFIGRVGVFSRAPRPDLLLLDMMLPDGSGLEVIEAMNEIQEFLSRKKTYLSVLIGLILLATGCSSVARNMARTIGTMRPRRSSARASR